MNAYFFLFLEQTKNNARVGFSKVYNNSKSISQTIDIKQRILTINFLNNFMRQRWINMVLKNIQDAFLCLISNISASCENIQQAYGYMQEIKGKSLQRFGGIFLITRKISTKILASGFGHCIYKLLFLLNKIVI